MKTMIRIKPLLMIVGLIWALQPMILTAQSTFPGEQLIKDIEISASVLDRMIAPKGERFAPFGRPNTRGYYVNNYGVIFNTKYSLSVRAILPAELELLYELKDSNDFDFEFQSKSENAQRKLETELEQLKTTVIKFLSTWTSALIGKGADEKITVIIDINDSFFNWPGIAEQRLRRIIASVAMSDIRAFRKDSINEAEFSRRVKFERIESSDEETFILSNIIETALARENQISPNVVGHHLKGYGAIFFADIPFGAISYKNLNVLYRRAAEQYKTSRREIPLRSEMKDDKDDPGKTIEKIEQKLIQILSNYGYNLKQLRPDEWVEIFLDYRDNVIRGQYSKSIIRVQKQEIDAFNREKINFDEFKKRVLVSYY